MRKSDDIAARRVLVALDTSPHGRAALDAAANLAANLQAELQGLFVEDVNLMRLAGLPFAREVASSSTAPRPLDPKSMEQTLRAKAERVRRALADTANRASVRWSFQVTRGHVTRAALEAATEADLLIMGRENPRPKAESTEAPSQAASIVAVYDGSQAGCHTLQAAMRLRGDVDQIVVVGTARDRHKAAQLHEEGVQWLLSRGVQAQTDQTVVVDSSTLTEAALEWHARLLLINRDSPLLDETAIDTLVNELDCPVGLVR